MLFRSYNKWSCNNLPGEDELGDAIEKTELGKMQADSRVMTMVRVLLWFILPLFVLTTADRIWVGSKLYKKTKHKNKIINFLKQKNMRKKIVAGNWKMNMNLQEGVALATELNEALAADKPNCDVAVAADGRNQIAALLQLADWRAAVGVADGREYAGGSVRGRYQ